MTRRVLFVCDPELDAQVLRRLEATGFSVSAVKNLENAADLLTGSRIDLLVLDLDKTADAIGFIKRIRKMRALDATSVLAVGEWGSGLPTLALSAGADAFEPAPIKPELLGEAIERVLNKRAAVVGMNE